LKVQITGRHFTVSEALKDYTNERAGKLMKFYDRIHDIRVIMDVDGDHHKAEMSVGVNRGITLVAHGAHNDIFGAVDLVVDKMERQLTRFKEKLRNHKNRKKEREMPIEPEMGPEPEEEIPDA